MYTSIIHVISVFHFFCASGNVCTSVDTNVHSTLQYDLFRSYCILQFIIKVTSFPGSLL